MGDEWENEDEEEEFFDGVGWPQLLGKAPSLTTGWIDEDPEESKEPEESYYTNRTRDWDAAAANSMTINNRPTYIPTPMGGEAEIKMIPNQGPAILGVPTGEEYFDVGTITPGDDQWDVE